MAREKRQSKAAGKKAVQAGAPPPAARISRARETEDPPVFPPDPGSHRGRVAVIVRLMLLLQWQRGKTGKLLAKAWPDVKLPTMRRLASEASSLADMVVHQRADLVKLGRAELVSIGLDGDSDQTRIAAWRVVFEQLGELRQRHLVTPARDALAEMTDAELQAFADTGEMPKRLKGATTDG